MIDGVKKLAKEGADRAVAVAKPGAATAAGMAVGVADKAVDQAKNVHGALADKFNQYLTKFEEFMTAWMKQKVQKKMIWIVDKAPEIAKDYLADPDMPRIVGWAKDRLIDGVWPDVREEVLWETAVRLDGVRTKGGEGPGSCCILAYLRYHLYPYDKSFWGRLREPVWFTFTLLSMMPVSGVYAIIFFFIFLIIDKRDEYQLIYYILQFKGTQFLSHGVLRGMIGFFMYVDCVTAVADAEEHACETRGPGMFGSYPIIFGGWVLQVVLVFIAWLMLPYSKEKGRSELQGTLEHERTGITTIKGSYITYALLYDLICFVLCALGLGYVIWSRKRPMGEAVVDWPVKHALYATQVVYGYLAMPFFVFTLPLFQPVLTHSVRTAYDRQGRTCRYDGPDKGESKKLHKELFDQASRLTKQEADQLFNKIKVILTGGSVDMNNPDDEESKAADMAPIILGPTEVGRRQ